MSTNPTGVQAGGDQEAVFLLKAGTLSASCSAAQKPGLENLGEYAIKDTHQALFEARRDGIDRFCITIDETALAYLPQMYAAAKCVVTMNAAALPYMDRGGSAHVVTMR